MGNCCGGDGRTRQIDKKMRNAEQKDLKKIKILLLGAGESGKTTLFKQMKLLFTEEKKFSPSERDGFKKIIYKNILSDMAGMLDTMEKRGLKLSQPEASQALDSLPTSLTSLNPQLGELLELIWKDPTIQNVWETRGDVQVQDALKYFMENVNRISSPNWEPTNQDILRARAVTTGVKMAKFTIARVEFEMYDVGGQRTERKKWIHYFDGVTTVLFVAAISEYNQVLYEDNNVNRQDEAVALFKAQLETEAFATTPFILFLNKKDLFREKLTKVPFKVSSGENARNVSYTGPEINLDRKYDYKNEGADPEFEKCYAASLNYLIDLYKSQSPAGREQESIYPHPTNSTDSENIKRIMNACKDIILKDHLSGGGWV